MCPKEIEFAPVVSRESSQFAHASRGDLDQHGARILRLVVASHVALLFCAIDQFHGAVVAQLQRVGNLADGYPRACVQTGDAHEQLVLLRGQPFAASGKFAGPHQLAQRGPETSELAEIGEEHVRHGALAYSGRSSLATGPRSLQEKKEVYRGAGNGVFLGLPCCRG